MELYKLAGSKLREALQLDPLLPWLLDVRKRPPSTTSSTLATMACQPVHPVRVRA
jgi:hypothetical protein